MHSQKNEHKITKTTTTEIFTYIQRIVSSEVLCKQILASYFIYSRNFKYWCVKDICTFLNFKLTNTCRWGEKWKEIEIKSGYMDFLNSAVSLRHSNKCIDRRITASLRLKYCRTLTFQHYLLYWNFKGIRACGLREKRTFCSIEELLFFASIIAHKL